MAANNTLIRGLDIVGFSLDGILLQGAGNSVQELLRRRRRQRRGGRASGSHGIEVSASTGAAPASRGYVDNVISGNDGDGVSFSSNYASSEVMDNHIGVDVSGSLAVGNGGNGVYVGPAAAKSGGVTVQGNVISGNFGDGVTLEARPTQLLPTT